MEKRERDLSAAEKQPHFPGIDWSEHFAVRKWSACNFVVVERHHINDATMVREWDYGTPAYFVLSNDNRVFFSNRGSHIYDDGWEADPVSVNKPDRVRRIYQCIVNPNTSCELDEAFSGEAIALDKCYTTDLRWDRSDPNPQVNWDEIVETFKLQPVEAVTGNV